MARVGRPLLVLAALLLGGCVSERHKTLVLIPEGAFSPEGPEGAAARRRGSRETLAAQAPLEATPDVPPESRVPQPVPSLDASTPAAQTAGPYAGHRPLPEGVSLEQALREKFLRSTTTVDAEKATLYVPPDLAREARLTGASVVEEAPGRRVATGNAVLVLRRLTVRAARVTLVARDDGTPDVALSARGRVAFRADLPASVVEERDLRSLLLRNDGYTPLR